MSLILQNYIKYLLTLSIFFSILNEVSAQDIQGSIINSLHDPRGLHLRNTKIYSQSELNGFIRLSGSEENNEFMETNEYAGERVVYYNGTYNYEITQVGGSIYTGTFSIDLDSNFNGDDWHEEHANRSLLDPSKSNYLYKQFNNAFSIDISSLNLAPGDYSLSIDKEIQETNNHNTYNLSFSIIDYNLTAKTFTTKDDIVLTGVSNLSNENKIYSLEKYIEYDGTDRNICVSNCTISSNNSFVIQSDGSWTIDLTTSNLEPGEYKIVVDNSQEFVFQVRSALGSKDNSQTITLDPIIIQEDSTEESFLFQSNYFSHVNKYTDYHRIELIKPIDWNDIEVVGEPKSNGAEVERELFLPDSDFTYAYGTQPNYNDFSTLKFGNYNYTRILEEGKAIYSPDPGLTTTKIVSAFGDCGGYTSQGGCGTYFQFHTSIDYLEPHFTYNEHLFKEMTIKSIFDAFAYQAIGYLRELDTSIDRDFEFRLFRYNSNGDEIYDVVKVTAKLITKNDFASIRGESGYPVNNNYQQLVDSYDVPEAVRDFLTTIDNDQSTSTLGVEADGYQLLKFPVWQHDTPNKVEPVGAQEVRFKIKDFDYNSDYNLELYFENGYQDPTKTKDSESGTVTIETEYYTITHPILFSERFGTLNAVADNPWNKITVQFKDINKFTPGDSPPSNILLVLKEVNSGAYNAASYIELNGTYNNFGTDYSYDVDNIIFEATPNFTSVNTISEFPLSNSLFTVSDIDFVDSDYVQNDLNDGGFSELILNIEGIVPGLNEKLIFDGEEVSIISNQTGVLSSGYSYDIDYATDGKSSIITLDLTKDVSGTISGNTNEATKLLIESINYKIEGDPCSLPGGERSITINKISK